MPNSALADKKDEAFNLLDDIFNIQMPSLSKALDYSYRSEQHKMAKDILASLDEGKFCLCDAPTGIGKSLAYLIPAMLFSYFTHRKIVVCTDTNTLLSQLYTKDAPQAKALVVQATEDPKIKFSLIMGKSHYICKTRLDDFLLQANVLLSCDDVPKSSEAEYLRLFYIKSEYASQDELSSSFVYVLRFWNKINICDDSHCALCILRQSGCKYYDRVQKRVLSSDIILTNHSLLFSELALRLEGGEDSDSLALLPKYSDLIVDEAHGLPDNFQKSFAKVYDSDTFEQILGQLVSSDYNVFNVIKAINANSGYHSGEKQILESAQDVRHLTSLVKGLVQKSKSFSSLIHNDIKNISIYMLRDGIDLAYINFAESIINAFDELKGAFFDLQSNFSTFATTPDSQKQTSSVLKKFEHIFSMIQAGEITIKNKDIFGFPTLHKLQVDNGEVVLTSQLVFSGEALNKLLYCDLTSCVFCSATLNSADNFAFYKKSAGLCENNDRICLNTYKSSFDYQKSMKQYVLSDIDVKENENISEQAKFIENAITLSNGGALILFASYKALSDVFNEVSKIHKNKKITLLSQSSSRSASSLTRSFRSDKDSVLFATSSFWQGVDFKGDTLRLLIVHKLPFSVPGTPLAQARTNLLKNLGSNYFNDFEIPSVSVKMRQAVGRLIRSENDRGVSVIMDARLFNNKSFYGKIFPVINICDTDICTSNEALESIRRFFSEKR